MGKAVRIQLAIQGGGAKIIGLVATMEALQNLERQGKIEITRLAGTSAGAIVAALYSAGAEMSELRLSLGTGELKLLFQNYSKPKTLDIAKQLIAGSPICDPEPIRNFLRDLLARYRKEHLRDLKPEVQIVSANVATSSKHSHPPDDTVLEALMSSTAIPFVFRVWDNGKQPPAQTVLGAILQKIPGPWQRNGDPREAQADTDKKEPLLVDGGICENLPINELLKDEYDLGPVVAITFSSGKYYRPKDILGFGKAVMDTAIDNSVYRARSLLPASAIFEIGQWFPISTLDFAEAIAAAGNLGQPGTPYLTVRQKAKEFFEGYIQRQVDGNPETSYDPWSSDNTTVRKVMEANWHVCSTFCRSKMRFDKVSMVVTIPDNGGADQLTLKCQFSVLTEPMTALRLSVMNTINNDYLGRTSWNIRSVAQPPIDYKTTPLPIRNPDDPAGRWIALYFETPLPANSGPYELEISDYADVILDELRTKKKDVLVFESDRSIGITAEVDLVVVHPTNFRLSAEPQKEFAHLSNRQFISKAEKDKYLPQYGRDRYDVTGFRISQVPEAKAGITIHLHT